MMEKDYTERLEEIIKKMLRPLQDLPFKLVIEALSGFKIIPFDPRTEPDKTTLIKLSQAVGNAGKAVNENGITRSRPNEVGNDIEDFVKVALRGVGYNADTPRTKTGSRKTTGYPDLVFTGEGGKTFYLECKTYNIENVETTLRSFYLSPSENFKVTRNAVHLAVSYETYVSGRLGNDSIWRCKHWKLVSLENLLVNVKYEFNSDNKRLYSKHILLAEGSV